MVRDYRFLDLEYKSMLAIHEIYQKRHRNGPIETNDEFGITIDTPQLGIKSFYVNGNGEALVKKSYESGKRNDIDNADYDAIVND